MALLQGGDLRAALDGPHGAQYLWRNLGAGIASDIACGLAYIHTTGVVHRCFRPEVVSLWPCILHNVLHHTDNHCRIGVALTVGHLLHVQGPEVQQCAAVG
jgi:hypothetical protein